MTQHWSHPVESLQRLPMVSAVTVPEEGDQWIAAQISTPDTRLTTQITESHHVKGSMCSDRPVAIMWMGAPQMATA